MTQIYEKWRELSVNPLDIPLKNIVLKEIVSYPPAQNDVVECVCDFANKDIHAFLKYERSRMADFASEIKILQRLNKDKYDLVPRILEDGMYNSKRYMVLSKLEGERLSDILKVGLDKEIKYQYLLNYGKELANIHSFSLKNIGIAKQRIINDYPKEKDYKNIPDYLKQYITYLKDNLPEKDLNTFIHGDFHYANILWDNLNISGILDWEYSGIGFKEQDIAWACILRPTQKFMDSIEDLDYFLKGYKNTGTFDETSFYWCLLNGYLHFYLMNLDNKRYINILKKLMNEVKLRLNI